MTEATDQAANENAPDLGGYFVRLAGAIRQSILDEVNVRLSAIETSLGLHADAIAGPVLSRLTAVEEKVQRIDEAISAPEDDGAAAS